MADRTTAIASARPISGAASTAPSYRPAPHRVTVPRSACSPTSRVVLVFAIGVVVTAARGRVGEPAAG
jgi:hypothetical protein